MPALFRKYSPTKQKFLIPALVAIGLIMLILFASMSHAPSEANFPEFSGVTYPENYLTLFHHYAIVQRPDGTIRELYINDLGYRGIQNYDDLPFGTIIVIEGYSAMTDAEGNIIVDADGHYVKGKAFPMIHVREKRSDWSTTDFVSNARNGYWNSGSFELETGRLFHESLNACFHCHNTAPTDFLYSYPQMQLYSQKGVAQYLFCPTTGRTACES